MTTHTAVASDAAVPAPEEPAAAGPFDRALRTAIAARGLSLERLHARLLERGLRVSMASLSNWQRGKCRPERAESLDAVHALEEILGVPRDGLVALLGPPRPRGRWVGRIPGAMSFRDVTQIHDSIDLLLNKIERPADGRLRWRSVDECLTVGEDRAERSIRTRIVFEALVDGVDRHVALHHNDLGVVPDVRRASWCRMGRIGVDESTGVCAMELLFDHPLRRGETYVVEYEFGHSTQAPLATMYQRYFRFPTHDYLLQVRFDPGAVPARIHQTWQRNAHSPRLDVRELRPSHWQAVHLAARNVAPGVHGIRWEWG
ncbi:MAG TPA: hypothetical protein VNV66_09435 [Pilimelia sp.]|nr:hypothetical protein [Pilimelia sp.]